MTTDTLTNPKIDEQHTASVNLDVVDGPILEITGYSHNGKSFRVERLLIKYRWIQDGWQATYMSAQGTILKKDGSKSQLGFSSRVYIRDTSRWSDESANYVMASDTPEAFAAAVDEYRPTSKVVTA